MTGKLAPHTPACPGLSEVPLLHRIYGTEHGRGRGRPPLQVAPVSSPVHFLTNLSSVPGWASQPRPLLYQLGTIAQGVRPGALVGKFPTLVAFQKMWPRC